jgi:16S rRNA (guanine527-N7)-methyltransferase
VIDDRAREMSAGLPARINAAIADLVARYHLPDAAADQLRELVEVVAADPHAPTTVRTPRGIIEDHLADSLVGLEQPEIRAASRIADLGSGAGFPGLPLAIALPATTVSLIESASRKRDFIASAAAACGVGNAEAIRVRAEEWRAGIGSCDVVVARALSAPDVVAEYAAPLLRTGGTLVLWRGRRDSDAEAAGARAAADLGLVLGRVTPVHPYPGAEHRHLHLFTKASATPGRFPRRPGVARKRPLGGRKSKEIPGNGDAV